MFTNECVLANQIRITSTVKSIAFILRISGRFSFSNSNAKIRIFFSPKKSFQSKSDFLFDILGTVDANGMYRGEFLLQDKNS
jgi:hypothetical protein